MSDVIFSIYSYFTVTSYLRLCRKLFFLYIAISYHIAIYYRNTCFSLTNASMSALIKKNQSWGGSPLSGVPYPVSLITPRAPFPPRRSHWNSMKARHQYLTLHSPLSPPSAGWTCFLPAQCSVSEPGTPRLPPPSEHRYSTHNHTP